MICSQHGNGLDRHATHDSQSGERRCLTWHSAKELLAAITHCDPEEADPDWPRIYRYIILGQSENRIDYTTYAAVRKGSDRPLEIRLLHQALADEAKHLIVQHQFKKLQELRLPFVPDVSDCGVCDGRPYIVASLIEALPIQKYCQGRFWDIRQRTAILIELAHCIHRLHQKDGPHADLRPQNILVDEHGQLHVTAYGITRIASQLGHLSDSPSLADADLRYTAPEVRGGAGERTSLRADIYSLGKIAYLVLAGAHNTENENSGIINKVLARSARRLRTSSIPRPLAAVIAKATSEVPDHRFDSAQELAAELARWINGDPVLCAKRSAFRRFWKRARA